MGKYEEWIKHENHTLSIQKLDNFAHIWCNDYCIIVASMMKIPDGPDRF